MVLKDIPTAKIFATTINSLCTPKQNITQLLKLVRQQQLPYLGKGICLVLDEVHQVAEKLFEPSCETNYQNLFSSAEPTSVVFLPSQLLKPPSAELSQNSWQKT